MSSRHQTISVRMDENMVTGLRLIIAIFSKCAIQRIIRIFAENKKRSNRNRLEKQRRRLRSRQCRFMRPGPTPICPDRKRRRTFFWSACKLHGAITWCYYYMVLLSFRNQWFCEYLQTILKLANLINV